MKLGVYNTSVMGFKGRREDRNTVQQLKQDNNYSLTENNKIRISKAINNLADESGENNVKFLLDVADNLKKNKNAYNRLKAIMVPEKMKLAQFRKYYHSVLSVREKEVLINMGLDPWSVEGLKYVGDCRRFKIKLGDPIPDNEEQK